MAETTLASALVATTTYTALGVTPMTSALATGEQVWVGLGLETVEAFIASAGVAIGATSIPVVSRAATNSHAVDEPVAPDSSLTTVGRGASPMTIPRGHRL